MWRLAERLTVHDSSKLIVSSFSAYSDQINHKFIIQNWNKIKKTLQNLTCFRPAITRNKKKTLKENYFHLPFRWTILFCIAISSLNLWWVSTNGSTINAKKAKDQNMLFWNATVRHESNICTTIRPKQRMRKKSSVNSTGFVLTVSWQRRLVWIERTKMFLKM